jgi:hypothetical protein
VEKVCLDAIFTASEGGETVKSTALTKGNHPGAFGQCLIFRRQISLVRVESSSGFHAGRPDGTVS